MTKSSWKLTRALVFDLRAVLDLVEAQWALAASRLARKRRPLGRLVTRSSGAMALGSDWEASAQSVVSAVNRAARFGLFRPTCLEYAMALQRMLHRRRIGPGVIRVGVQLRDGVFTAHAWLQLDDQVLGESLSYVSRFRLLTDVTGLEL